MYRRLPLHVMLFVWLCAARASPGAQPEEGAYAPKVMVINMFAPEAAPWLKALTLTREIPIPSLLPSNGRVRCTEEGVCQITIGMGHANAAASVMAVVDSELLDLRKTYFLIAGIAGIDPDRGTIGSATWAHFVVDLGIAHEIDARELPRGWQNGYFGVLTNSPDQKPRFDYGNEVFRLNDALVKRAALLSKRATLEDSDDVRIYRQHYRSAPANQPPQVIECDTGSDDTWWVGARLAVSARHFVDLLTDHQGIYCTTQQEDNATLTALARAARSQRVDLNRVAILRTGTDFDRPYSGQDPLVSLREQLALRGAIAISTQNLLLAGMPLVQAIVAEWPAWQDGVPGSPAVSH
jgi:purine nucleoside permease